MERDHSMSLSRSGSLRSSSRTTLIRRNQSMSAKQIRFYRNGDRFFSGLKLAVSPERYKEIDALLAELSNKLDLSSGAVRFIFNGEDGSMITDISQLHYGVPYVCSSSNTFKQLEVGYGKTATQWALAQKNSRSINTLTGIENLVVSKETSSGGGGGGTTRDFIKPKLVTVIRNGKPPQKKVTLLLNNKTAISLDQVLDHLSAKGALGKVDKLYSVDRKLVKDLRDLFDDDTVFIAFSSNEKFPEEGVELDPNSTKQWQSSVVVRHNNATIARSEIGDLKQENEDGNGNRWRSSKHSTLTATSKAGGKGMNSESPTEKYKRTSKDETDSPGANQPQERRSFINKVLSKKNEIKNNTEYLSKENSKTRNTNPKGFSCERDALENQTKNKYLSGNSITGRHSVKKAQSKFGVKGKSTGHVKSPVKIVKQAFYNFSNRTKREGSSPGRKGTHARMKSTQKRKQNAEKSNEARAVSPGIHGYFVYVHDDNQGKTRPTALVKPSVPGKDVKSLSSCDVKLDETNFKAKSSNPSSGAAPVTKAPDATATKNVVSSCNLTLKELHPKTGDVNKATSRELQEKPAFQSKVEIKLNRNEDVSTPTNHFVAYIPVSDTKSKSRDLFEENLSPQFTTAINDSGVGLQEYENDSKSLATEFANIGESLFSKPISEDVDEDECYLPAETYDNGNDNEPKETVSQYSTVANKAQDVMPSDTCESYVIVSMEPSSPEGKDESKLSYGPNAISKKALDEEESIVIVTEKARNSNQQSSKGLTVSIN